MDPLSLSSVQILVYFDNTFLANATGFIIKKNGQLFLVTNWHVVTGRNHDTWVLLGKNAVIPNKIVIKNKHLCFDMPLYINDFDLNEENLRNEYKKWLEYPSKKEINGHQIPKVDVVLLPINIKTPNEIVIFDLKLADHNMTIVPALPVCVIGFPFSDDKNSELPVWITGFVASEPTYNVKNLPLLYINAAGYEGLSGSPVVVRSHGFYQSTTGLHIESGYHTKFIGIYSGRINAQENDSLSLCHVWKPEVIDQILKQAI